ncbi:MAG: hypothetical protein GEU79_11535 [Acidimicrobiia bacterium]|nr:hypothetical protein [Acidimicrobiia bacterium]
MMSKPGVRQDAREQAHRAAEAIRQLNHHTLPHEDWPGLDSVQDLSDVVTELTYMVGRLPQACEQQSLWLDRHAEAIGDDRGDPSTVEELQESLLLIGEEARKLHELMSPSAATASHLHHPGDDRDPEMT